MEEKTAFELLKQKKYPELRAMLATMEPADIVLLLEEADEEDLPRYYRILPKELAYETFAEMDADMQENLIRSFSDNELSEVLEEMFLDDTVDMIEEMPAALVKRILRIAKPEMRKSINELLNYPKDSAGSIMTIEYVDLKKTMRVSEAFDRIRKTALDKETVYTCYVTDAGKHLIGIVTAKDLLLAPPEAIISDIMDEDVIYVSTHEDKEEVAKQINKYGFLAMPVVDAEKRLVGIVTVDDAIDVMQEETDEDFQLMAAVTPSDDSYFKTSVLSHARHRIVWLLILMLSATFTGIIITHYEAAMSALLVSFIPMLMDTGGNCGSQSSVLIIRGMAVDEIKMKDFGRVLFKEIRIALVVGITLACANALRIYLMYEFIYKNSELYAGFDVFRVMIVVGLTIVGACLLAKTLGCCLPMLAKRCKLDPAVMASPMITTIVDACTVFLYFNVAIWILKI
ncbi:MAG: magnesium transporter [Clostridia bacterium]|nr:magnesium transporter [Clostridia bacterium]